MTAPAEGYAPVPEISVSLPSPHDGPDAEVIVTAPPSFFVDQFRFRMLLRALGICRLGTLRLSRGPLPDPQWCEWIASNIFDHPVPVEDEEDAA